VRGNRGKYYAFDWSGDHWSQGCGTHIPPGLLSTVGPALRAPIGRVVWAGADTGDRDRMEGAVTPRQRTAGEAVALVG
jgi:monoamine oxidase